MGVGPGDSTTSGQAGSLPNPLRWRQPMVHGRPVGSGLQRFRRRMMHDCRRMMHNRRRMVHGFRGMVNHCRNVMDFPGCAHGGVVAGHRFRLHDFPSYHPIRFRLLHLAQRRLPDPGRLD